MSLVASRLALTHKCSIERDNAAAAGWGETPAPDWQPHLTDQPCRAWVTAGHETADSQDVIVFEEARLLLPAGTDVTERDRVGDVTYRGATIVAGPIQIRAVIYRRDFLELVLVRLH